MINFFLIILGKALSKFSKILNLGNGSTWPGHIALAINKNIIKEIISESALQVILVAGTNGKTTTAKLIRTVLEENGKSILQNQSGANLLNGIASTIILQSSFSGKIKHDFAIFEVDENALPLILKELNPKYLVLLNLFRDQLDRYGEIDEIIKKWKKSMESLLKETTLILNADDPAIAYLGIKTKIKVIYFGLKTNGSNKKTLEHAADSIYCPVCQNKLNYKIIYYSHLGIWNCDNCGFNRPSENILSDFAYYPLIGIYNNSNTLAAVSVLKSIGIRDKIIIERFKNFKPAYGRQEKIVYRQKNVQIFLSKNPTGFNQSLRTIEQLGAKTLLLILNDRIADGKDISWIWDIDFPRFENILISGDRVYDMSLRIKYSEKSEIRNTKYEIFEKLNEAIAEGLKYLQLNETLYILPTYTAMLEVRKILTGRSIL